MKKKKITLKTIPCKIYYETIIFLLNSDFKLFPVNKFVRKLGTYEIHILVFDVTITFAKIVQLFKQLLFFKNSSICYLSERCTHEINK